MSINIIYHLFNDRFLSILRLFCYTRFLLYIFIKIQSLLLHICLSNICF